MGFQQDGGQSLAKLRPDWILLGEMIERLVFIEASHFDGPLDNRSGPSDCRTIAPAYDWHHPAVDGGA